MLPLSHGFYVKVYVTSEMLVAFGGVSIRCGSDRAGRGPAVSRRSQ